MRLLLTEKNTVFLFQQDKHEQATESPPRVSLSLFLSSSFFSSSSSSLSSFSSTKTSWTLAKPCSSAGIPCQQFTRPHPVWGNKETRAISCLSYCQPPPSAHLLTFPSFGVTRKRRMPGPDKGRGKIWHDQGSLPPLSFRWLQLLFLL